MTETDVFGGGFDAQLAAFANDSLSHWRHDSFLASVRQHRQQQCVEGGDSETDANAGVVGVVVRSSAVETVAGCSTVIVMSAVS